MSLHEPEPDFLTTREVATLLRVKERKVYDLAAAGGIPHRRVTGKLLFPRVEIDAWLTADAATTVGHERPAVLVGSHDPLLDWSLRECGSAIATLTNGSADGLERFVNEEASICALHLIEDEGWNRATVAAAAPRNAVLVHWATRSQGLMCAAGKPPVESMAALSGLRLALRQSGAGTRALFEHLANNAGLDPASLCADAIVCRSETDVAAAVAADEADAALGPAASAASFGLTFTRVIEESVDLLIDRRAWFTAPVQQLLEFSKSPLFATKAERLGGYDIAGLAQVRWLGP